MYTVKVKLADNNIELPKYETKMASGLDVRAWKYSLPSDLSTTLDFLPIGFILNPHERVLIKTGIHVKLPQNKEIQVRPRSGLALKHGITCANAIGTVDEDYRGDIGIILLNTSNEPFVIKKGDRIGQLVLMNVDKLEWEIVEELSDTVRGIRGFGSTNENSN